jgi:NAD(P)-dependent dehydrogenase (short-subunit alcohol dehydrogenase family)
MACTPALTRTCRSNKGIGFAVVRGLTKAGVDVVLTARNEARGTAALAALQSEGLAAGFFPLDVTKPESIAAAAEHVKSKGGLDVLVGRLVFDGRDFFLSSFFELANLFWSAGL